MKRYLFVLLMMMLTQGIWGSGTTDESDYLPVEGEENWEHTVDISGQESGTYNLLIRGIDRAGNVSFSGPYNILIDPDSDLPIVSITNPVHGMRVGGDLNIVGTCRDDDAVSRILVKIDDGPFREATGTDFWTYSLPAEGLDDGVHTITVKGVDINGLEGPEASVYYNLDTLKPVNSVENYPSGTILSGHVEILGSLVDANGIKSLSISIDGRNSFLPMDFDFNEEWGNYSFSLPIDTTELEDGPQIYWFKSVDKTNSVGYSAFLFFVDNQGPVLEVLSPGSDDTLLNGTVNVTGTVRDEIGVQSLKYVSGEIMGEIELYPGNPYWSQDFDFSSLQGDQASIQFILEDVSGNISTVDIELMINHEADKPVLRLSSPENGVIYKETISVEGFVSDDDDVTAIEYSLNNGEKVRRPVNSSFHFSLDDLTSGEHSLSVWGVDRNGIQGNPRNVTFQVKKAPPVIKLETLADGDDRRKFISGINVMRNGEQFLQGSVDSQNTLSALNYRINGSEWKPLDYIDKSGVLFSLDINEEFPYGVVELEIQAIDNFHQVTEKKELIYVKNYTVTGEPWGFVLPGTEQFVYLKGEYSGLFFGPDILSVRLEPETDLCEVSYKNKEITVVPLKDGMTENVKIVVETSKGVFRSPSRVFITDSVAPEIELISPKAGRKVNNSLLLEGAVSDASLEALEYRYSGDSEFTPLEYSFEDGLFVFKKSVPLKDHKGEAETVIVRARDKAGNTDEVKGVFYINANIAPDKLTAEEAENNSGKSSDKPVLNLVYPLKNEHVLYSPGVSGWIRDDDGVREVILSNPQGEVLKQVKNSGIFHIPLKEFGKGDREFVLTPVDENGTEGTPVKFSYVWVENKKDLFINTVAERNSEFAFKNGASVSSEKGTSFLISREAGLKYPDAKVWFNGVEESSSLSFKGNTLKVELPENLPWGRNRILINMRDEYNRIYSCESFFFKVDKNYSGKIIDNDGVYFSDIRIQNRTVNLSEDKRLGGFFKGREIHQVYLEPVSDFLKADFIGNKINITAAKDGISEETRFVVKTIDGDEYRSDAFIFYSDRNPPVLFVDNEQGEWIQEDLKLNGSVSDNIDVVSVKYSLDRGNSWSDIPLSYHDGGYSFSENLNMSSLKDGGYTLLLKAEDRVKNTVYSRFSFIKDSTAPGIQLITPGKDEVNGLISIKGVVSDNIQVQSLFYSNNGTEFTPVEGRGFFSFDLDFSTYEALPESFFLRALDYSGNITDIYPGFFINQEGDKPQVQIQIPGYDEVIRNDFVISGMVFDDDAVQSIYYRIDDSEFKRLEGKNNFSIPVKIEDITNNEHTVEVKAVDIRGVESNVEKTVFWVSKEEPVSSLILPEIHETKKGIITLEGSATDENGIKEVYISMDNGVSFQKAEGAENWTYSLDTTGFQDGTYSLFVKAVDKLNTEGFYSTLINIDNTQPELELNGPFDGESVSEELVLTGRSFDNIYLSTVEYNIYRLDEASTLVDSGSLNKQGVFNVNMDLSDLDSGDYNIELIALDRADNSAVVTRNFTVREKDVAGDVELLFPLPGSRLNGTFMIEGRVTGEVIPENVICLINDSVFTTIPVSKHNFFNFKVDSEKLGDGIHSIVIKAKLPGDIEYTTEKRNFTFSTHGGWISIDNLKTGDYISNRPYLTGRAGYSHSEGDNSVSVERVDVSLNNGQSFTEADGDEEWKFRIETQNFPDGLFPVLVKATFSDGTSSIRKIVINIDETEPTLELLNSLESQRFNEEISFSGTGYDKNGLSDISVVLRKGDKSNYAIPQFIQGLYLDAHFFGATDWDIGAGLTFFDDVVKLQVQGGQAPEGMRFSGNVLGVKLLANISTIPMEFFFGPDWDFLSMSVAVGSNFSYYSMGEDTEGVILAGVLLQWEFAKITFDRTFINNVAAYTEYQSWFISSDVSAAVKPKLTVGARVGIF